MCGSICMCVEKNVTTCQIGRVHQSIFRLKLGFRWNKKEKHEIMLRKRWKDRTGVNRLSTYIYIYAYSWNIHRTRQTNKVFHRQARQQQKPKWNSSTSHHSQNQLIMRISAKRVLRAFGTLVFLTLIVYTVLKQTNLSKYRSKRPINGKRNSSNRIFCMIPIALKDLDEQV